MGRLVGQRVLLVDDAPGSRETLAETLASWGMVVRATASPREALSWIEAREPFDVGLLDEEMPELDGRRLAEAIRLTPRRRRAPAPSRHLPRPAGRRDARDLRRRPWPGPSGPAPSPPSWPGCATTASAGGAAGEPRRRFRATWRETHPLRILLAEDNAVNQKVALSYLSRMGYAADVAGTGLEALEAVRRESYDVVLMDVQMPEMDGFEATRRIRALGPGEKDPWIVALTASAMTGDPEKCSAAGMNDYLSKPVRVEDLAAALRRAPRRTRRWPPAADAPRPRPGTPRDAREPGDGRARRDSSRRSSSSSGATRRSGSRRWSAPPTAADAESFRRAAHSLKSSAASLGGARVEAHSAPGWRPCRPFRRPSPRRQRSFPSLRAECAALLAALGLADGEEGARLSLDAGEYGRS